MQPITLYVHGPTPNPVKVAIILEELELPYECKSINMETELKAEPFITLNPNGRLPAIDDPNTGIKLFEVWSPKSMKLSSVNKSQVRRHHRVSGQDLRYQGQNPLHL